MDFRRQICHLIGKNPYEKIVNEEELDQIITPDIGNLPTFYQNVKIQSNFWKDNKKKFFIFLNKNSNLKKLEEKQEVYF